MTKDYNYTIMLDPNYAEAYNNRGIAYLHEGQYDRAIEELTHAITLKPDLVIAFENRSSC